MDLIITIAGYGIAAIALIGLGAGGYRFFLKRDPVALEAWAQELKAAGKKVKAKVDEL